MSCFRVMPRPSMEEFWSSRFKTIVLTSLLIDISPSLISPVMKAIRKVVGILVYNLCNDSLMAEERHRVMFACECNPLRELSIVIAVW